MSSMSSVSVPIVIEEEDLLPSYATPHASGADARAAIQEPKIIPPGGTAVIPTGVKAAVPPGYEIQVRPRSGFAVKHQVTVLNTPGTIDADYRGEICVILVNHGKEPFTVLPKMRIAQFVLAPVCRAEFIFQELSTTQRGEGGFGHTGAH